MVQVPRYRELGRRYTLNFDPETSIRLGYYQGEYCVYRKLWFLLLLLGNRAKVGIQHVLFLFWWWKFCFRQKFFVQTKKKLEARVVFRSKLMFCFDKYVRDTRFVLVYCAMRWLENVASVIFGDVSFGSVLGFVFFSFFLWLMVKINDFLCDWYYVEICFQIII